MGILLILTILIPLIVGVCLYFIKIKNRNVYLIISSSTATLLLILNLVICFVGDSRLELFKMTSDLVVLFNADNVSHFFSLVISVIWVLVAVYSHKYLTIEENENKFYTFYFLSYAMLMQLCYSGNLITMYLSFEMVTLASMPLVIHSKSKESISAALKYLFYSIGGAFLGLLGIFFIYHYSIPGSEFTLGGCLDMNAVGANNVGFQIVLLLTFIGFGAKAGMFPLHGWLPTAHPVAPSPASAVLSGIITKAGVFSILRILFYCVGTSYIQGTWVQYAWVSVILFTILLGSMMALIQKNFKKRLAYSSVSQLSYILLGIAMMTEDSLAGSFLHVASHASIKVCLFLVAGAIILYTGKHDVDELDGIGKQMPITMWCYTIASLGLIGIPPTGGFVSKWYLATGSIASGLTALNIIAPIVLLISAILTAGYLLPITIKGFFPSDKTVTYTRIKESPLIYVPLIILATLTLLIGLFGNPIVDIVKNTLF